MPLAQSLAHPLPVRRWRVTALRLFCGLLALMLVGCAGLAGEPEIIATFPPATVAPVSVIQPADLAAGARIYAENCTRCHGINGAGDGELALSGEVVNPGNFTDPTSARSQTPQDWFHTITNGRLEQLMPPWADALSEQERWDVALYTYTLHYQPEQISAGQALTAELNIPPDWQTLTQTSDAALYEQIAAQAADLSDDQIWNAVAAARTASLQNVDSIGQEIMPPPQTTEEAAAPAAPIEGVTGTVTGTISNGTAGGSVPPGMEITLFATDNQNPPQRYETMADTSGAFRFDEVLLRPDQAYVAVTAYQERTFTSNLERGETAALDLPIMLYEATDDPAAVTISSIGTQITAVGDGLQVLQLITFTNTTDRMFSSAETIRGDQFASVVISLPPGAVVLGFPGESEQRYVVTEDQSTILDTAPVLPGSDHIIQFIYFLPYTDGAIIEQPLNYAFEGPFRLLLLPQTVTVVSEELAPLGPQTIGDTVYSGYGGTLRLQSGESIRYELRGTGATSITEFEAPVVSSNNLVTVIIVVLIGQAILIGGLYFFYRRRKNRQPAASVKNTDRLIDALAQQIAELDEAHDRGEINHDVYQRRRQQLKARLAELMDQPGENQS